MKQINQIEKRNLKNSKAKILIIVEILVIVFLLGGLAASQLDSVKAWIADSAQKKPEDVQTTVQIKNKEKEAKEKQESLRLKEEKQSRITALMKKADRLAQGYYYDEAIQLIQSYEEGNYLEESSLTGAVKRYQKEKKNLVPYEGEISHVFFHSLIADNSKAFDGDRMSNGYNYWMTTVSEFKKMMEVLYQKGYVLISMHDITEKVNVDGKKVMKKKKIMLPKGKIPFVLSQDDVNYYEYMKTDGFATKIVIDKDGNSANEIKLNGKTVIGREYDVIPLLDTFVEEHPDFSYRGAKGIIAVTGYEGTLGYRTNNPKSKSYEQDKKKVKKIAKTLKKKGWEFASHSYGHRHMADYPTERFKKDCNEWKKEVEELVGKTDIYIYPYGEEIQYSGDKYNYLRTLGFDYFCGVYAKPWIQIKNDYVRMTRRNLDGFTMHFYPERLTDLFHVKDIIDKGRPEFK